jgi:hypothetical protein
MNVSRRHIITSMTALAGTLVLVLAAGPALAGNPVGMAKPMDTSAVCCTGAPTGPVIAPPGMGVPQPHFMPGVSGGGFGGGMGGGLDGAGCCKPKTGHDVIVPGVNVPAPSLNVVTPNVVVNQGGVNVNASVVSGGSAAFGLRGTSGGETLIFGGGGGYFPVAGVAPSAVGGLNVVGGTETVRQLVTEQVPVTQTACAPVSHALQSERPVRAVCMDDKGTPHPASRTDDGVEVPAAYTGELFRCMAGTQMQVTLGQMVEGRASFEQGESFSCAKGEALVHGPGGELSCAPQTPERNCNERSLLRKFGPGIKVVAASAMAQTCRPVTQTVMQSVTREVMVEKATPPAPIVFDGGVGQGIN